MSYNIKDNPLFPQPEMTFIEDLKKPLFETKPDFFGRRQKEADEIDLSGAYLVCEFPDNEGLLETAFDDFNTFLKVYEIGGNRFPVAVRLTETSCFEEYVLTVSESGAYICAADTEGIRRGLIYLEDLIIESEGPFLRERRVTRRPVIKSRITRSFFSPTNRPPFNIDELSNEVDYYPDEYLNRIAHDGNNGVWIYTHFSELVKSDIITEYGRQSDKQIAKLKKVVAKCKRYGIKVYVFGIEPMGLAPELQEKYADIAGAEGWNAGKYTFCPRTKKGHDYLIEAVERLFRAVPDLGGFIDITAGERVTTCCSVSGYKTCPRCEKFGRGENLSYTLELIREGMRRAGTNAEFISWTYGHREWSSKDVVEYVRTAPEDVMLMQNFGDFGFDTQLGKPRMAIDYWLSYVGPAERFVETAQAANKYNKHIYAKMQICCSHEVASVPYLPVPERVFEKYKQAYKYNVEGVVQCWYMGNYPSIMSKAAGELSFMTDFGDKDGFLEHLAGICYGRSHAKQVAEAWKLFSEGYSNFPTNVMLSYYGPMHDSIGWKLSLLPKDSPLPRSWWVIDGLDGDRIGEALQCGHTLDEAIFLCEEMCRKWKEGLEILPEAAVGEMASVARALDILFESGTNILKFYDLRQKLGYLRGNPKKLLEEMRQIVLREIENSRAMIPLCKADNRLGYHSEAVAFKFFPRQIEDRIAQLEALLETEFSFVEGRINEGKAPIPFYVAEGEEGYKMQREETDNWVRLSDKAAFRVFYDKDNLYLDLDCEDKTDIMFRFEYDLLWPAAIVESKNGKADIEDWHRQHHSIFGERLEIERSKYSYEKMPFGTRVTVNRQRAGWVEDRPLRLAISADGAKWKSKEVETYPLVIGPFIAGEYGWLIP